MNATHRTVLVALVFALIASSLVAVDTDAKRKRKHRNRKSRAGIVRVVPDTRDADVAEASFARIDLPHQIPQLDPSIQIPAPDSCGSAAAALNRFLPQTVTLKKTDNYWAKLILEPGVSILACDPTSGSFAVRFDDVTLEQYGKASTGGVSIGGWNLIASLSG